MKRGRKKYLQDLLGDDVAELLMYIRKIIRKQDEQIDLMFIDPEDFPTTLSIFPDGSLHEYDIVLFYRNIEENVEERVEEWLEAHGIAVVDD